MSELDEMLEILRLKKIAEKAQRMFDAQQNADTPVSVSLEESDYTVELSPRDVGEMYNLITLMARPVDGWGARNNMLEAQKFMKAHKPRGRSAND
jgi:hypothetical protein